MTEYYQEIQRRLDAAPQTGLLTLEDNLKRERLQKAAADLHQIAALVEVTIGRGLLSEDIRKAADGLHSVFAVRA